MTLFERSFFGIKPYLTSLNVEDAICLRRVSHPVGKSVHGPTRLESQGKAWFLHAS